MQMSILSRTLIRDCRTGRLSMYTGLSSGIFSAEPIGSLQIGLCWSTSPPTPAGVQIIIKAVCRILVYLKDHVALPTEPHSQEGRGQLPFQYHQWVQEPHFSYRGEEPYACGCRDCSFMLTLIQYQLDCADLGCGRFPRRSVITISAVQQADSIDRMTARDS